MADAILSNEDLAPTRPEQRTWSKWHIAALWVGMSVCIPTYMLAGNLIGQGLSFGMAILAIAIGNLVVLVPLVLNAHPGTEYGIPFPVLLRSSFGVLGANVPAMMRAMVACGWFGIQTWIGGTAIHAVIIAVAPSAADLPVVLPTWFGITILQFLCFAAFWLINVALIWRGMNSIKILETWAAPLLLVLGVALFAWAWSRVGGLGDMLGSSQPVTQSGLGAVGVGITASVAFWGTLALNIPDFARFARSQRDQAVGQALGLPATMTMFAFIGAAVTNASVLIFGEAIADPTNLLPKVGGPVVVSLSMIGLAIATLSTNLAANVVSPANDFSNLAPSRINFRRGAMITAGLGFVIMPWKLLVGVKYIFAWLIGYGTLLGAVGGVMIVDYYLIRRRRLVVDDLYRRGGQYEYRGGFNPVALVALGAGIAPLVPGFLAEVQLVTVPEFFTALYRWSWFVAFAIAGAVHYAGMSRQRGMRGQEAERTADRWSAAEEMAGS